MATIVAVRSGNWNDTNDTTGPWPGTTPCTIPGVGDTADAGDYVVTLNVDVVVDQLQSSGTGHFLVAAARQITGQIVSLNSTRAVYHTATATLTVIGNVYGSGDAENGKGIQGNSSGNIHVTGDVYGGNRLNTDGISNASGNVTVVGTITGGSGENATGVSSSTGNITATIIAQTGDACAIITSGQVIYTGDVVAVNAGNVIQCGSCTIIGNVEAQGGAPAILVTTSGTIRGNVTAGSVPGISGESANIEVVGNLYASADASSIVGKVVLDGKASSGSSGKPPVTGTLKIVKKPGNDFVAISDSDVPYTMSIGAPRIG